MSQRRNSQPSQDELKKMEAGIEIVQNRRKVDELRVTIINISSKNMETPVLIIQGWLKGEQEKK